MQHYEYALCHHSMPSTHTFICNCMVVSIHHYQVVYMVSEEEVRDETKDNHTPTVPEWSRLRQQSGLQLLPFCPLTALTSVFCFQKCYADADEHRKFALLGSFNKLRVRHTHFLRQAYKSQRYDILFRCPISSCYLNAFNPSSPKQNKKSEI